MTWLSHITSSAMTSNLSGGRVRSSSRFTASASDAVPEFRGLGFPDA
jgi:hypothetical protein